ncbi:putative selenate ABC transporter substrate-binding protein [Kocuria sp. SM24M-10]|uniref:putative selenate ABC transporter substrate-binding protein n=1 Tax=Kocuria sp. SM24M-10 TaxID=1660349 RepID=UPI000AA685E8|nr:putative selenate ABC transporter substrate-binding protein [Kocuria sp. SM24M-10]
MSMVRTCRALSAGTLGVAVVLGAAGCGASAGVEEGPGPLRISAIPDVDPSDLAEREEAMAAYLADELDVAVEYVPVSDYAASVSLFGTGDLDVVFYGGLTGVQARLRTEGAAVLAQRDIDERFRSVVIAHRDAGLEPVEDVAGLAELAGSRFTFGSESSTSGRLMPAYFLGQAGVDPEADFAGAPGYSGSHDLTIDLVESGSYQAGAVNLQVWEARTEAGTVDTDVVQEIFTTPAYADYHWVGAPGLEERFGGGFTDRLRQALLDVDGSDAEETALLEQYGAGAIVPAEPGDYDRIEQIARTLGLVG